MQPIKDFLLSGVSSLLQLGKGGPRIKANAGVIEARDAADAAYSIIRGATPAASSDLVTRLYANGLLAPYEVAGIAGTQQTDDDLAWITKGFVYIDPTLLPAPTGLTLGYTFQADVEVAEDTVDTVQAGVRLVDASGTALATLTSTIGGASVFPQHLSAALVAGVSNGQVRPTATGYKIQLKRTGGTTGDQAICHKAYLVARWS